MKKILGCVTKLSIVLLLVSIVSGCQGKVDQVKNMVWDADKSLTLGKALDNYKYFEKREWSAKKTDNGKEFIEFIGTLDPSSRQKEINNELTALTPKIDKLKKELEENYPKLKAHDVSTISYYTYGCSREEDKSKCMADGVERFKTGFHTMDENLAMNNYNAHKSSLENDLKNVSGLNDELNFYKNGNRIQIVYQFLIQQDKTISIEYGGYQKNKAEKTSNFNNYLQVLSDIYKNEPIMKYIQ